MIVDIIVLALIGIGILFALLRLVIGPTSFDRVVALDTVNVIITALIVFLAYYFRSMLYLDIALVYAILSFLETLVFARFLEGRK
ncbi:MAG: monovalent cation/H+ antiporter complex subunit F [Bacillota bacterium]|nr:monovalent cation/H+ antiporter complex subunit F [Bacillota bacterium]